MAAALLLSTDLLSILGHVSIIASTEDRRSLASLETFRENSFTVCLLIVDPVIAIEL